jgi:hypothetical protein
MIVLPTIDKQYNTRLIFYVFTRNCYATVCNSTVSHVSARTRWPHNRVKVTLLLTVYRQSVRLGVEPLVVHNHRFFQLILCGYSPSVTSSLTRRWVYRLVFRQVYVSHM